MGEITDVRSFGDVRRVIIDTIMGIRNGAVTVQEGMAIAANMKVLNDNINAEVNAAKLSLLAEDRGHSFGRIAHMGARMIADNSDESAA